MPLNKPGLKSDLEALFADPPPTAAECAQAWASAVGTYAADIVPVSTTVSAASAAMVGPLLGAFTSPAAGPPMDAAFLAFATAVAGGMLPLWTGLPPTAPLGMALQFAVMQSTHADAAAAFADRIHLWLVTGSATLVAPPKTLVTWT